MECRQRDSPALDQASAALPAASRAFLHAAICDSCDTFIVGTRYHCVHESCADFDLCQRCLRYDDAPHAHWHALLVLPRPSGSVKQLAATCQRFDVTISHCGCGNTCASHVCSVCCIALCEACSLHHDPSHALIWTRSSPQICQNYPLLPCLWNTLAPQDDASSATAPQRALRSTSRVRPMMSRDLDAVMAIEAAGFTEPYERDVFESFVSRASVALPRCWAVVAVPSDAHECASDCADADSDLRGYCLTDASGWTARVISLATAAMYRGQGVGSLLLKHCMAVARQQGEGWGLSVVLFFLSCNLNCDCRRVVHHSACCSEQHRGNCAVCHLPHCILRKALLSLCFCNNLRMYQRLGFVPLRRLAAYYAESCGDVDAWEMECDMR